MKLLKSFKKPHFRSLVWVVLFSFLLQTIPAPVYAQRGIFVREPDTSDEEGNSFRTVDERENLKTGNGVPSKKGAEGGLQRRLEVPEGVGREGMGTTGMGLSTGGVIYQIHVLGEVKNAGTYRVPPSTRVSEALQMAGGLKKNGSERYIEVRRPQGPSKRVDLLSYKTFGKLEDNPYLMDNEVIYIPLKQKVVEIEGAVNRPGIYEMRGEQRLADVIKLAGGFTQGVSHKEPIRVIRYDEDEKKNILEFPNDAEELRKFNMIDGDVVVIPHIFTAENEFDYNLKRLPKDNVFYPSFEDRVFVIGAVEVPGAYNFNQYYKLSNYIALAGGTTRMAKGYVKVVDSHGKATKAKPDSTILINPGDTIYAPEKALSRETWITILTTMASLGLSATAIFTR